MTNGRVTYKDIMEFQERVFGELTDIRSDISKVREEVAVDRTATKSLLRRDTVGYVWDSFNTIAATIVIALYWGRS
jgi:hypothetical protein